MAQYRKKNICITILIIVLILMAYCFRIATYHSWVRGGMFMELFPLLRSGIYILLFSTWAVHVKKRILQIQTRRYLVIIALLMVFWLVIRMIKYDFVEDPCVGHWLWYLYYLPLLFGPLFCLYVAHSICQGEEYRISKRLSLLYIPTMALFFLVMTNDLHQLVFAFPEDGPKYPGDGYRYEIVYFMIVCWVLFCFVFTIITVFTKNRMEDRRRRILIPILILSQIGVYSILYNLRVPFIKEWLGDLPVFYCLSLVAFFESLFWLNMIQNNRQYSSMFYCSSIPAVIVDENYKEKISTKTYHQISESVMRQCEQEAVILQNGIRVSSAPIHMGHVIWQEDIFELVELNKQLETTRVSIEEQNAAEMEAYQADRQRRQIEEKNRLYDKLQAKSRSKVEVLECLLNRLEQSMDPEEERWLLLQISVIGAYIKRRSNLSFLSEDWGQFPARELENCITQSIDCLTLFGIDAEQEFALKSDMHIKHTIRLYEVFEEAVEYSLSTLSELFMTLNETKEGVVMKIRLCTQEDLRILSAKGMEVQKEGDCEWLLSYGIESGGDNA